MGRSSEPKQPDPVAVLDAGHTQAAKAYYAGAQQRGGVEIVELRGQGESKIGANDRVFRIAAVHRVTGKRGRIAEILHAELTIPARAVGSSNPGNAYTRADRKILRCSGYDFADNLMSGDHSGAKGRQVAFDDMQIGATYSTYPHTQKNLTWRWLRPHNFANMKRPLANVLRER
jgi:hypothetical protein